MITVLYVDDEGDLLELAKVFLERQGEFRIDTTTSAGTALDMLVRGTYDAIISDYQMPEMDGIHLLKQVRALGHILPFILFTGRGREEVVIEALNNGADFYLQKGGDPTAQFAELSQKIRLSVSQRQAKKALMESEERFRDLTENSLDTIMLFDRNFRHLYVNPNIEQQTGIPAGAYIGRTHRELGFPQDLVNLWEQSLGRVFSTGKTDRLEFQLPNGMWIDWLVVPVKGPDGSVLQVITSARDITDRRKAEEQIRLAEFSLEHSGISTFWLDENARVVRANQAACDALGYTRDEFTQISVPDFDPFYQNEAWAGIWERIAREKYVVIESLHKRKDGTVFPVEIASSYFEYAGKKLVFSFARDIRDRKDAEAVLREREALFHSLFDQAFQLAGVLDTSGTLIQANATAMSMIDKPPGEVIGRPFWDTPWWVHDPSARKKVQDAVFRALGGETVRFETTHIDAAGDIHYIDFTLKPVIDKQGKVLALLPEGRDITDYRNTEQELIEKNDEVRLAYGRIATSEGKFRDLVENAVIGIYRTSLDGRLLEANPAFARIFGYDSPGGILSAVSDVGADLYADPGDRSEVLGIITEQGVLGSRVLRGKKKDGSIVWVSLSARVVLNDAGGIGSIEGTVIDITDRKRAEDALRESEQRFRKIFEASPLGIALVGKDFCLREVNPALCRMLGYGPEELIGKTFVELTHPADLPANLEDTKNLWAGIIDSFHTSKRYIRRDGSFLHADVTVFSIRDNDGRVLYTIPLIKDLVSCPDQ